MTAIGEVEPTTVLMVGIAFGVDPEKQPIGQVLISRQVHHYDPAKVNRAGKKLPRGDKSTATSRVLSRLRAARRATRDIPTDFGLVLSGESLVDNLEYRQALLAHEPEAVGGEMEGCGLYVAATERGVDWCLVKAVCDYADGNKAENKAERQATAASNAAKLVVTALSQGGFAPNSR